MLEAKLPHVKWIELAYWYSIRCFPSAEKLEDCHQYNRAFDYKVNRVLVYHCAEKPGAL